MATRKPQALLPRFKTDLVEVMLACAEGRLAGIDLEWSEQASVCVIAAAGGYPGNYARGKAIKGLDKVPENGDVMVFQAGTTTNDNGELTTAGGRVLGVTVKDTYLRVAIERAYECMGLIKFEGHALPHGHRAQGAAAGAVRSHDLGGCAKGPVFEHFLARFSGLLFAPGFSRWVEDGKNARKAGFQPGFSTRLQPRIRSSAKV